MTSPTRDERGAATLLLVIVFMVSVVVLLAPVLGSVSAGFNDRRALDQVRNREYAADGAIQYAIAQLRGVPASDNSPGPGLQACGPYSHSLNGVTIRVDCAGAPVTAPGSLQYDVVFTACVDHAVTCGSDVSPIVTRAQVNFQVDGSGASMQITGTSIQSWSVNG
jgi:hypothetical protein